MISGTKKKVILKTEEIFDEEACNSLSEITLGNFFLQTLAPTWIVERIITLLELFIFLLWAFNKIFYMIFFFSISQ